jgi:hypothetical protein
MFCCLGIRLLWLIPRLGLSVRMPGFSQSKSFLKELVAVGKELLESRLSALREGNPNMDFELRTAPPLHSNCGMLSLVTTSGTP